MAIANRKTKKSGFTLVEMMVTILILTVVMLGLAGVMADSHKGYNRMYKRIHGDVVNDAYVARLKFDKICRKARAGTAIIDGSSAPSLKVLYYFMPNVSGDADLGPDRYAEFYLNGTDLMLDTGTYDPGTEVSVPTSTETVARNVADSSLKFSAVGGKCCQMIMTLADDEHSITVTCSSIMHN